MLSTFWGKIAYTTAIVRLFNYCLIIDYRVYVVSIIYGLIKILCIHAIVYNYTQLDC